MNEKSSTRTSCKIVMKPLKHLRKGNHREFLETCFLLALNKIIFVTKVEISYFALLKQRIIKNVNIMLLILIIKSNLAECNCS